MWNGNDINYVPPAANAAERCPCPNGNTCGSYDYVEGGDTTYRRYGSATPFAEGDTIGIALNADDATLEFYLNGVAQNVPGSINWFTEWYGRSAACNLSGEWVVMATVGTTITTDIELMLLAPGESGYALPEGFSYW